MQCELEINASQAQSRGSALRAVRPLRPQRLLAVLSSASAWSGGGDARGTGWAALLCQSVLLPVPFVTTRGQEAALSFIVFTRLTYTKLWGFFLLFPVRIICLKHCSNAPCCVFYINS